MIEKIKEYWLVLSSGIIAILVFLLWRRGDEIGRLRTQVLKDRVERELTKQKEVVNGAVKDYESKRNRYNDIINKYRGSSARRRKK